MKRVQHPREIGRGLGSFTQFCISPSTSLPDLRIIRRQLGSLGECPGGLVPPAQLTQPASLLNPQPRLRGILHCQPCEVVICSFQGIPQFTGLSHQGLFILARAGVFAEDQPPRLLEGQLGIELGLPVRGRPVRWRGQSLLDQAGVALLGFLQDLAATRRICRACAGSRPAVVRDRPRSGLASTRGCASRRGRNGHLDTQRSPAGRRSRTDRVPTAAPGSQSTDHGPRPAPGATCTRRIPAVPATCCWSSRSGEPSLQTHVEPRRPCAA